MKPADSHAVAELELRRLADLGYEVLRGMIGQTSPPRSEFYEGDEYRVSTTVRESARNPSVLEIVATVETLSTWRLERATERMTVKNVGSRAKERPNKEMQLTDHDSCVRKNHARS